MSNTQKEYAKAYAQTEAGKEALKRARTKYNKKNREKNNERGRKKWKRVAACLKACEGFDDPMALRQQRDFAVRALHNLMAHQPKPDNPSVEWLAYYDFLDSIDIVVD